MGKIQIQMSSILLNLKKIFKLLSRWTQKIYMHVVSDQHFPFRSIYIKLLKDLVFGLIGHREKIWMNKTGPRTPFFCVEMSTRPFFLALESCFKSVAVKRQFKTWIGIPCVNMQHLLIFCKRTMLAVFKFTSLFILFSAWKAKVICNKWMLNVVGWV